MTFLEQCDRFLDITRNRPLDTLCTSHDRWHHDGLAAGGDFGRAFVPAAEAIDRRRKPSCHGFAAAQAREIATYRPYRWR